MVPESVVNIEEKDITLVEECIPEGEEFMMPVEECIPEGEEVIANAEDNDALSEEIKEKLKTIGYAYVYDGQILDESKLTYTSNTFCIINMETGMPFIYNGAVVTYGGVIEANAALNTLKMYAGKDKLSILAFSELENKSML